MIIDEYDFEKTARAVFIMNDSAREIYDSWEELKDFMVSMAYTYRDGNHFGTGGFVLTFFDGHSDRCVTASVNAYVALQYAERMAKENA
jgi:hypothetical protein